MKTGEEVLNLRVQLQKLSVTGHSFCPRTGKKIMDKGFLVKDGRHSLKGRERSLIHFLKLNLCPCTWPCLNHGAVIYVMNGYI